MNAEPASNTGPRLPQDPLPRRTLISPRTSSPIDRTRMGRGIAVRHRWAITCLWPFRVPPWSSSGSVCDAPGRCSRRWRDTLHDPGGSRPCRLGHPDVGQPTPATQLSANRRPPGPAQPTTRDSDHRTGRRLKQTCVRVALLRCPDLVNWVGRSASPILQAHRAILALRRHTTQALSSVDPG